MPEGHLPFLPCRMPRDSAAAKLREGDRGSLALERADPWLMILIVWQMRIQQWRQSEGQTRALQPSNKELPGSCGAPISSLDR